MKYLKSLGFSFLALILGVIGLSLVFSDLSHEESMATRIVIATLFFFFSGVVIGFFNPAWWMTSGITAWGGVLMGGVITLSAIRRYGMEAFGSQEPPHISSGLIMLFFPITFSLTGGYIGRLFGQMRMKTQR